MTTERESSYSEEPSEEEDSLDARKRDLLADTGIFNNFEVNGHTGNTGPIEIMGRFARRSTPYRAPQAQPRRKLTQAQQLARQMEIDAARQRFPAPEPIPAEMDEESRRIKAQSDAEISAKNAERFAHLSESEKNLMAARALAKASKRGARAS